MSVLQKLFGVGLAFNVIGLASAALVRGDSWMTYINIFGCVMFGCWLVSDVRQKP